MIYHILWIPCTQIPREMTCRSIMIREAYVDVTVEDSLQEETWIVYLCFLVSLWMKDLPVYTFTKDSALTFFIIHCGFMYYISFSVMIQLHFFPSVTSICQVVIAGSILILPHGDPTTCIVSVRKE